MRKHPDGLHLAAPYECPQPRHLMRQPGRISQNRPAAIADGPTGSSPWWNTAEEWRAAAGGRPWARLAFRKILSFHGDGDFSGCQLTATTILPAARPSSMARCASMIWSKLKTRVGLAWYRPVSALVIICCSGMAASGKSSVPSTNALP